MANTATNPVLDPNAHQAIKKKKETMLTIAWERFIRNKLALIAAFVLIIIIFAAIFAPQLATHDPSKQVLRDRLAPPSLNNYLGTDDLGRDIFSRLLYGARVSLLVGFLSVAGSLTIGTIYGAISGYYGGRVDNIMMRIVDVFIAFPSLFLLITVVTILEPSIFNIIVVFIIFGWTGSARLIRGEFLSLKKRDFVDAARVMGASDFRIIFRHILPNAIAPIIVAGSLGVAGTILGESALSFLGLGVQPPDASWGNMLQGAQNFTIMIEAWWYPLFPGLMIFITVLCLNFIGNGLRDALDPRMKD